MKSFPASVLLLLSCLSVRSQQYYPLVDSGAVWNVEQGHCDMGGTCTWCCDNYGERLYFGNDTIVQGENYKSVWIQPTYYYHYIPVQPWTSSGGNISEPPYPVGLIREDTLNKVWFQLFSQNAELGMCEDLYSSPLNTDILLYDFTIQIGDTFTCYNYNSFQIIVTSIDSIQLLNGEWRKQINFNFGDHWIEGIGSDFGLFAAFMNHFECGASLTCYRKNDELLYDMPEIFLPTVDHVGCDSIDVFVGINDFALAVSTFEVSPNPATDFLSIKFSSENNFPAQLVFTDFLGRIFLSEAIESDKPIIVPIIDFSNSGMIFCQLWQNGELIASRKIIIQGD